MNETLWHSSRLLHSNKVISAKEPDKSAKGAKQEGLKILVAEDGVLQQALVSLLLKRMGHTVTMVGDGFEAVTAVQVVDYDVLLIDCQMPLMNGIDATRFIRQIYRSSKRKRDLIIIGITTSSSSEECFESGMDYFLHKPLKKPILEAVLGRLKRDILQTRRSLERGLSSTFSD